MGIENVRETQTNTLIGVFAYLALLVGFALIAMANHEFSSSPGATMLLGVLAIVLSIFMFLYLLSEAQELSKRIKHLKEETQE